MRETLEFAHHALWASGAKQDDLIQGAFKAVLDAEASEIGGHLLVRAAAASACCTRRREGQAGGGGRQGCAACAVTPRCASVCPVAQPPELREQLAGMMISPELMVEFTLRLLGLEVRIMRSVRMGGWVWSGTGGASVGQMPAPAPPQSNRPTHRHGLAHAQCRAALTRWWETP